jgi:hypothetical protein
MSGDNFVAATINLEKAILDTSSLTTCLSESNEAGSGGRLEPKFRRAGPSRRQVLGTQSLNLSLAEEAGDNATETAF